MVGGEVRGQGVLGTGYRDQGGLTRNRVLVCTKLGLGFRMQSGGFWVLGFGLEGESFGFRVQASGFTFQRGV